MRHILVRNPLEGRIVIETEISRMDDVVGASLFGQVVEGA